MSDPLGLIGPSGRPSGNLPSGRASGISGLERPAPLRATEAGVADGAGQPQALDFKGVFLDQLKEVNDLGQEATRAMEDLQTGKRNDFESVMLATQKADLATQMLLQLRNKVMTAYEEVKQIRV